MNTLVTILKKPNQTFEYLDKKYKDVSNPDYDLIFMLFGAFSGLISFLAEYKTLTIWYKIHPIIGLILTVPLGAGIAYIFGKHIMAPITYWIGKALKGQAIKEQIRMLIAYSWIPLFFRVPFDIYYGLSYTIPKTGINYWIITGVAILTFIWAMKIEIQGLMFFNKYGLLKAILNKLPFLILQVGFIYLTMAFN